VTEDRITSPSIQELVRRDIAWREEEGIRRYGTSLYPYNGRSAILDAYEEALDLAVYLRQVIEEMTAGKFDLKTASPQPTPRAGNDVYKERQR
jgi:hypothetical protein